MGQWYSFEGGTIHSWKLSQVESLRTELTSELTAEFERKLTGYAYKSHSHSEYASKNHSHSNYASSTHKHQLWVLHNTGHWCRNRIRLDEGPGTWTVAECGAKIAGDARCDGSWMQRGNREEDGECRCVPRRSTCDLSSGDSNVW